MVEYSGQAFSVLGLRVSILCSTIYGLIPKSDAMKKYQELTPQEYHSYAQKFEEIYA